MEQRPDHRLARGLHRLPCPFRRLHILRHRFGDREEHQVDADPGAGIGIDLMFFSVAEPVTQHMQPPEGAGQTMEAARQAMVWTLFHYGLTGWSMYALMGIALGYFSYRYNLPSIVCPAPSGGCIYCVTGSATEKNIKSMPIPAANSIADQLNRLNSGFDCSGPSLIAP